MRRRHPEGEDTEPSLFDLPLDQPDREPLEDEEDDFAPEPPRPRPARLDPPPAADRERDRERPAPRRPQPAPVPVAPSVGTPKDAGSKAAGVPGRAGLGGRLAAGLADLLVHAAIAAIALGGSRLLGAEPTLADWPALALFLVAFSFLYTILPLAFWGQTLGMTWAGLLSRNRDGEPLTFDQTARRWLGGLLTTATLGLPLLVAGRGRTLTDLLSGSATYRMG
ncbi:MAG TPA: RDD family protein [Thermoanaerobaculia bacterium]|nr:RDD family protein [Thermoanaerobaculia bacterium]